MWRGDWSGEPAVQWTHKGGQFGVAKITEKGNVIRDPILRLICQTMLDPPLCDPKRRKELELWEPGVIPVLLGQRAKETRMLQLKHAQRHRVDAGSCGLCRQVAL